MPWCSSVHRGSGYKSRLATRGVRGRARGGGRVRRRPRRHGRARAQHDRGHQRARRPRCPRARRVLSTAAEHHANMLPWRRHDLTVLPVPDSAWELVERCEHALRVAQPRIDLVAVTGASNVTGEVWPLAELAAVAHHYGAELFVDAAQLAPHRAIDMAADGHRLPRAVGPQALRAVRGRRARRLRPRPRARRAAAARRRGDRARHARRRRLGRRARALRGGLAQRGGRGRARRGVPDPRPARDATAWRRTSAGCPRAWRRGSPACRACGRSRCGATRPSTASAWPPSSSRATATRCWPRSSSAEHAIGVRHGCFCAHPLLAHLLACRRTSSIALRGELRSGGRPAAARGGAGELRPRHHGAGRRPPGRRPGRRSRAAGRAGATCTTARTTSTARHPTCAPCRGRRATSRRPPARRRGR